MQDQRHAILGGHRAQLFLHELLDFRVMGGVGGVRDSAVPAVSVPVHLGQLLFAIFAPGL